MKAGASFVAAAFDDVKRAAMRIENACRAFDDQPVQIGRADRLGEGRAEAVEEIEDQRLLDLDLLVRPLQLRGCARVCTTPASRATRSGMRQAARGEDTAT